MSQTDPFDRRQNLYAEVEALISSHNGKKSVMAYTMYTLRKNGRVSVMLEFIEPPGYKDTRILIGVPKEGGFPDVAVMMNFFAVPFRIKALSRAMPFFGMDINSEDMNPRNPSYDTNRIMGTLLSESGTEMLIVESLPLIQSAYGKRVHYIDTRNHMCLKIEYFDKNGKPAKLLEVLETDTINGIFTAVKIKMSDLQKKSHTVLTYKNVAYGGDHSRFINETYLRTGRIPETGTVQTE
ncbi:outer membrane lipoprotein-sorting protein [Treponema sp. HNW]|uniref:outer membrane lipoprotein-sorting protein n=1 Tax=Treponema sp. HNW TaxID=3116654 RepID=UPI003D148EF0